MTHHHVIPEGDTGDHETTPDCGCRPLLDEGVWLHNAHDLREGLETGLAILPSGGNKGWGVYEVED